MVWLITEKIFCPGSDEQRKQNSVNSSLVSFSGRVQHVKKAEKSKVYFFKSSVTLKSHDGASLKDWFSPCSDQIVNVMHKVFLKWPSSDAVNHFYRRALSKMFFSIENTALHNNYHHGDICII